MNGRLWLLPVAAAALSLAACGPGSSGGHGSDGPGNRAPTAGNDYYEVDEDGTLNVFAPGVLSNDADPEGFPLISVLVGEPLHGTLVLDAVGSFRYVPDADYHGTDHFLYRAEDDASPSRNATVAILVRPVPDAPVSRNDSYQTAEDTVLVVKSPGLLGNDTDADGDPLKCVLVTGPARGVLALLEDGSFVYTPDPDASGTDGFTYKAWDGTTASAPATVAIEVTPLNDPPLALGEEFIVIQGTVLAREAPGLLANDSDADGDPLKSVLVDAPDHGVVVLHEDGSFRYTPDAGFAGFDGFTYKVGDGLVFSGDTAVSIFVSPVPTGLEVVPGTAVVEERESVVLVAMARFADGSESPVPASWRTSHDSRVLLAAKTGSSVVATGIREGEASVSASFLDREAAALLTVVPLPVPPGPGPVYGLGGLPGGGVGILVYPPEGGAPQAVPLAFGNYRGFALGPDRRSLFVLDLVGPAMNSIHRIEIGTWNDAPVTAAPLIPGTQIAGKNLSFDSRGRIYISGGDAATNDFIYHLLRCDPATGLVADLGPKAGKMFWQWALAAGPDDNVYTAPLMNSTIHRNIPAAGGTTVRTWATIASAGFPVTGGLAVNYRGEAFYIDIAGTEVHRCVDLNGDGLALDLGETTAFHAPPFPPRTFSMTAVAVSRGGTILLNLVAHDEAATSGIYWLADRNRDGDADDEGEAELFHPAPMPGADYELIVTDED